MNSKYLTRNQSKMTLATIRQSDKQKNQEINNIINTNLFKVKVKRSIFNTEQK